ncbi:glycosyltransferase family 2 protein [Nitrospirillum sp. BR 11164]|uniref:glycosyltransferase family 2 protein n=1 Tax=Nitrospirillum sp. BR 11164 TaxID=3104324 RepID=UPI002AFFA8C3|nr:glycosyltransferase family 2 protein [Nitrospirillum sp. BR 11164]MEA1648441.1 glycosyltransferase family 2 protein [Nitrospirillum sp. BR 11164]
MSLSVVIPLHNKQDYIDEALASLARQTQLPHEVIVVDDASTDDGAARAESGLRRLARQGVARTELLRLPVNGGPSAARNRGLERAGGAVLAFLDADDHWRDDCCSEILRCMRGHALDLLVLGFETSAQGDYFPDMGALRDEVVPLDGTLHRLPRVTSSASHLDFFMGRASNVAVRRGAIGDARFAEGRHVNENIDFWYRVAKDIAKGGGIPAPVGLLAEPVIRYRILPDSLSHRRCEDWRQLQIPPSLERFRHSDDADDRRLCRTLGRRWLTFAMESLPDDAQRAAFCGANGALLAHFDIDLPLLWRAA